MSSFFKRYHWHYVLLRLLVLGPFIVLHTIGEWAYTAGIWVDDNILPDPNKMED